MKWCGNVFGVICLSVINISKAPTVQFWSVPVGTSSGIQVKFMHKGHWVKVRVIEAKSTKLPTPTM